MARGSGGRMGSGDSRGSSGSSRGSSGRSSSDRDSAINRGAERSMERGNSAPGASGQASGKSATTREVDPTPAAPKSIVKGALLGALSSAALGFATGGLSAVLGAAVQGAVTGGIRTALSHPDAKGGGGMSDASKGLGRSETTEVKPKVLGQSVVPQSDFTSNAESSTQAVNKGGNVQPKQASEAVAISAKRAQQINQSRRGRALASAMASKSSVRTLLGG